VRVLWHRLLVSRLTYVMLALWLIGSAGIVAAAWRADAARWAALVTSLVGMAAGSGAIWAVRLIGGAALKKEAMGFGDVTLMAMIGAFLGWQACLVIFFVAPFFGLGLAVAGWVMRGEHEIPYGPFLCLGAFFVALNWRAVWLWASGIFALGWIVPALLAVGLVLMGILLWIYRLGGQLLS
jgi:prepilin signal peptidase PulO-like enzyme (type II secretory pathway)